jgi:nucleotide-binding universal stress UspA family protein
MKNNKKKLVIPTDFSSIANNAIHYAIELAKEFDYSIVLYHSFIPFESGFYSNTHNTKENIETETNLVKRLNKIKNSILITNKLISISIHIDQGSESVRLLEFCKQNKIALVVIGTSGADGLREIVIGSFTADIMSKAICPILSIPKGCLYKMPKKITFATGYNKGDIKAIRFLSEWNISFKAKINILHIDDDKCNVSDKERLFIKFKRKIETQIHGIPLSFQHITGKDIPSSILDITLHDKTDILAVSPIIRKGFWWNIFHKSITKKTAYHIHIPLLAIPIK